jgi:protein-export membrane protein SecD
VYQADLAAIARGEQGEALEALRDVIERRVNLFGVAEPVVQVQRSGAGSRLVVELAGVEDTNAAIRLIGETPYLEFREERPFAERDQILEAQKTGERLHEDPYFTPTPLTGRFVKKAALDFDPTTFAPLILLELTDEGGTMFAELTKKNIGKPLAIYLDGAPISAPMVQQEITGGKAQITGNFTPGSAKELVGRLNSGALPVPISLIAQQSVGASLGEESLRRSLQAGIFGFLAVALFMIAWYRLPGLVAVGALLLYAGLVLALFKLIPVTITVAGIAGFILSVGMAVDANVLIFERMREELRRGKNLEEAIREGFGRAWTSIRDSNASSLITAAILYWLGSSIVKGFALTLSIGVLVSMLSAISITRTLLLALMGRGLARRTFLFLSGFPR